MRFYVDITSPMYIRYRRISEEGRQPQIFRRSLPKSVFERTRSLFIGTIAYIHKSTSGLRSKIRVFFRPVPKNKSLPPPDDVTIYEKRSPSPPPLSLNDISNAIPRTKDVNFWKRWRMGKKFGGAGGGAGGISNLSSSIEISGILPILKIV